MCIRDSTNSDPNTRSIRRGYLHEELLKGLNAKCANRVKKVQEQVNSLKTDFNTTVNRLDTESSQLGTGLSATNQNVNRIEQIKDKILPLFQTGPADANYNLPHQVPVDEKVIRESLPEFQGRLEECPSSVSYTHLDVYKRQGKEISYYTTLLRPQNRHK